MEGQKGQNRLPAGDRTSVNSNVYPQHIIRCAFYMCVLVTPGYANTWAASSQCFPEGFTNVMTKQVTSKQVLLGKCFMRSFSANQCSSSHIIQNFPNEKITFDYIDTRFKKWKEHTFFWQLVHFLQHVAINSQGTSQAQKNQHLALLWADGTVSLKHSPVILIREVIQSSLPSIFILLIPCLALLAAKCKA